MPPVPGWSPADLLPGLYVILLVAGLAAALRRWYDPVPLRILALIMTFCRSSRGFIDGASRHAPSPLRSGITRRTELGPCQAPHA